jgi:hypothetical protein
MMDGIWKVFPSRMRLAMAGVPTMISMAATRPPSATFRSCWQTTP